MRNGLYRLITNLATPLDLQIRSATIIWYQDRGGVACRVERWANDSRRFIKGGTQRRFRASVDLNLEILPPGNIAALVRAHVNVDTIWSFGAGELHAKKVSVPVCE